MAQSKAFFGLRRGSTKSLTFSIYNGKQVTKDRVYEIKNPRTSQQMIQRAYMATAIKAYSAMKEICDHSVENLAYGQKTMNYFIKENLNMIRAAAKNINISFKGLYPVCNNYIVSKGSLPTINVELDMEKFYVMTINKKTGITIGDYFNAAGANNAGDMLTFILLVSSEIGQKQPSVFYWVRIRRTNENETKAINIDENLFSKFEIGVDLETNIDNFSPTDFELVVVVSGDNDTILRHTATNAVESFAVILSRKQDTNWLRSSQRMLTYPSNTYNYEEAIASYPQNGEYILNGGSK